MQWVHVGNVERGLTRKWWVIAGLILAACGEGSEAMQTDFFGKFRADQLGSTKVVTPRATIGRGEWQKMIEITAEDRFAVDMTVSVRAEYSVNQATVSQNPGPGGTLVGPAPGTGVEQIGRPLVGRIEWGVGGAYNAIEFDVPAPRVPGLIFPQNDFGNQPIDDIGNGVQMTVGASSVRVYVRNDANLGLANLPTEGLSNPETPLAAKVMAFVGPGLGQGGGWATRTVYISRSVASQLNPGSAVNINIPQFAKRVRFLRVPINTVPLSLLINDTTNLTTRQVIIPVNAEGPVELFAQETSIQIQNTGAVPALILNAMFDVTTL